VGAGNTEPVTLPFSESFDAPIYVNNLGSQTGLELFKGFPIYPSSLMECDFTYYVYNPKTGS
jgi:hypothetical protein